MQAVTAHLQIYASTPGLGLQGKHAEDLGVNLGVDIAGANLLFWDDHGQFFLHHLSISLSQLSEGAAALSHFSNRFASLLGPLGLVRFVQVVLAYPDLEPTGQQVKKHHPEK